ncbi:hypothetical protein MIZ03_4487 [Rhodoferax lithotrophicus]|uniref:Uncharacterized protein n=1 Tax=Rhodoferax lithotrophicus TaxID=2798804 RepID=A0ABM7MT71_9BURK|nr:hypothetical protein MIZ03_4487 [Rhodoferax sp. MIZ03]
MAAPCVDWLLFFQDQQTVRHIATHHANLPVNAEVELIYALEARDGPSQALAQSGLDRAHLADAILEGSVQSFKRRNEKYHF